MLLTQPRSTHWILLGWAIALSACFNTQTLAEEAITPAQGHMLVTEVKPGFLHQDDSSPENLLKLAKYTGDERYIGLAEAKLAQLDATPERELLRIEILHARHALKAPGAAPEQLTNSDSP